MWRSSCQEADNTKYCVSPLLSHESPDLCFVCGVVSWARFSVDILEGGIYHHETVPQVPPTSSYKIVTPVRRRPCVLLVCVSSKLNPTRVSSVHALEGYMFQFFYNTSIFACEVWRSSYEGPEKVQVPPSYRPLYLAMPTVSLSSYVSCDRNLSPRMFVQYVRLREIYIQFVLRPPFFCTRYCVHVCDT